MSLEAHFIRAFDATEDLPAQDQQHLRQFSDGAARVEMV
jgi:hypothetical protein